MKVRTHAVARSAYERVAARRHDTVKKKYGALAHKLPGMILENGLAQATGFLLAKDKDEHRGLLDDLNAVLQKVGATPTTDGERLHQAVINADVNRTMLLTRTGLEAAGWLKLYAQGVLGIDATGEEVAGDDAANGDTR